ncbi:Integral membrane protein [Colletotrichum asianum]
MIACNGWLDVVLYSSTRRSIVFSCDGPPSQETGLETFSFMCAQPHKFGNTTIVVGGIDRPRQRRRDKWSEKIAPKGTKSGSLKGLGVDANTSTDSMRGFGMGDGSAMRMAIQCETVTTVSVEVNKTPQVTRPKLAALGRKGSDASSFSATSSAMSSRSSGI